MRGTWLHTVTEQDDEADRAPRFAALLGAEAPFAAAREEMTRALRVDYPVLIRGETGTGKDLVARLLHEEGPRAGGPFVTLNSAAIPDSLLESELFGHRRGAFTGADRDAPGLFETARGGTLFLDEVHQLSLTCQCAHLGAPPLTVSAAAMGALVAAPWPGNVRQLIHELERATLRCGGDELGVQHLSPALVQRAAGAGSSGGGAAASAALGAQREGVARAWERDTLLRGLDRTGWNVTQLARELGISRRGLTGKLARHGLRR